MDPAVQRLKIRERSIAVAFHELESVDAEPPGQQVDADALDRGRPFGERVDPRDRDASDQLGQRIQRHCHRDEEDAQDQNEPPPGRHSKSTHGKLPRQVAFITPARSGCRTSVRGGRIALHGVIDVTARSKLTELLSPGRRTPV